MIYLTNGILNIVTVFSHCELVDDSLDVTFTYPNGTISKDVVNTSKFPSRYLTFDIDLVDIELLEGSFEVKHEGIIVSSGLYKINKIDEAEPVQFSTTKEEIIIFKANTNE